MLSKRWGVAQPLIVAGVLFVLVSAFWKEWRKGRSKGSSLI
ncbi:putative transporter small subunit [Martelella lutilitoris]